MKEIKAVATIYRAKPGEPMPSGSTPPLEFTRSLLGGEIECCDWCMRPEASALWQLVNGPVSICAACAAKCLPALLADAVVGERAEGARERLERAWQEATAAYWRAALIAVGRVTRAKKERTADEDRSN